jgi:hypothetical protein
MLCVSDCVADCVRLAIPQATEWQRIQKSNRRPDDLCAGGLRKPFVRMPSVNHQGQAHIVFTAIVSPGSGTGPGEVEATPWFPIDPQPASINPTITISIVFIRAFLVDCGRTIRIRQSKRILLSDVGI